VRPQAALWHRLALQTGPWRSHKQSGQGRHPLNPPEATLKQIRFKPIYSRTSSLTFTACSRPCADWLQIPAKGIEHISAQIRLFTEQLQRMAQQEGCREDLA